LELLIVDLLEKWIEDIDARFRDIFIDLIRQLRTRSQWLVMILEYSHRFESAFLYEVHERLEILIRLTRESDDECCTDE
jgi:hypothetical protein